MKEKCLVLLSGGQDSTTCLYWAKQRYELVYALTISYGQRHEIELKAAQRIGKLAHVAQHEFMYLGSILKGSSPLVDKEKQVGEYKDFNSLPGGLEDTFVPARNILFLTLAANRAAVLGLTNIITGTCEEDYGGYPDCRRVFMDLMQDALGSGINGVLRSIRIITPLMSLTKRETVSMATQMPGCMDAIALSHTCYNGMNPPCGKCHACLLRAKGFYQAGVKDPMLTQMSEEDELLLEEKYKL